MGMKIRDILNRQRTVSFEFFPPRERDRIPAMFRTIDRLSVFRPSFMSVTYGAGGSTRALTEEMVVRAKRETDAEVMAHLTCSAQSKEAVHSVLVRLDGAGIENVIALRGDPPKGQATFVPQAAGFEHATELIRHIKRNFSLGIAAACYPEPHPEAVDAKTDLEYARRKVDEGAEFLITQLFYDNRDFHAFVDRARQAGIDVPIVAGLMPVVSTSQIRRIASMCGAKIPPDLNRKLEECVDDDEAAREVGIEHTTAQARELWDSGVDGIHFYVLNRRYSVSAILRNLALPGHKGPPKD